MACTPFHYHYLNTHHAQVKERIPSLEELGGNQVYPSDPTLGTDFPLHIGPTENLPDRRPALQAILRSMLVSYSALMGSILVSPPINPIVPPEWRRHVEWITVLSQNLMAAANDLRPVQVRLSSGTGSCIRPPAGCFRLVNTLNA